MITLYQYQPTNNWYDYHSLMMMMMMIKDFFSLFDDSIFILNIRIKNKKIEKDRFHNTNT